MSFFKSADVEYAHLKSLLVAEFIVLQVKSDFHTFSNNLTLPICQAESNAIHPFPFKLDVAFVAAHFLNVGNGFRYGREGGQCV